jgi:uncharacterized membrane protein
VQVNDDLRVGTEVAGYRIEALLGWGGMSVVIFFSGLVLYGIAKAVQRSRGVDISKRFAEIPNE